MLTLKRSLITMCCALAGTSSLHAESFAVDAAAGQVPAQGQRGDCFAVGDVQQREACFAKESDDDIEACERIKPSACKPYKEMYAANRQLRSLSAELLMLAKKKYASYVNDNRSYLTDLEQNARASDHAWTTYRDAQCSLEPFVQGMSRTESGNLTEACRAVKTKARITELNDQISTMK